LDKEQHIIEQFQQIEQKVEELIARCRQRDMENVELKNKVEELERKLIIKQEAENRYNEERNLIGSKIDTLLAKLDEV
jgi:hypothetical protein